MSECACEVRLVCSLLVVRSQPVALLTNLPPNRQKDHLFQVPWCAPNCLPLSSCQQGKSHPQVVPSASWSTVRAAVFRCPKGDISNSKDMGLFTCKSQRPSLVPRQGEICLNYVYAPNKGFMAYPQVTCSGSSLSSLLKILLLAYSKSPSDLNLWLSWQREQLIFSAWYLLFMSLKRSIKSLLSLFPPYLPHHQSVQPFL